MNFYVYLSSSIHFVLKIDSEFSTNR